MKKKQIWMIRVALLLLALTLPFLSPDVMARSANAGQITMVGKVANVNQSGSIVIRGIQVRADAQAVQSIRVGMIVRVVGDRARDYTIKAVEVAQIRAGETFSAQGLIQSKQSTARTISFEGMAVSVPSSAKILSVSKKTISFADVKNGAGATIQMTVASDGSVQARQIQLAVPSRISGNLEGTSRSRYWLLLDEGTLFGDTATKVTSQQHKGTTFRNLIPGQKVSVQVFKQGDSTFYASGVEVLNADTVRLSGVVQNWNPANKTFQLEGFTVQWSGSTRISAMRPSAIDSVQISNGQFVKVTGSQQSNFAIFANNVQVQPSNRIEVRGILESVSASSITVDGTAFQVTSSTKVEDRRSLPIRLADLKAGNVVTVKAVKNADDSLRANQIELQSDIPDTDPEDLEVKGIVDASTAGSITVSGITIQITSSTSIRGDISKGHAVEVKARSLGASWVALEARQVDSKSIDDGDDHGNDDGNGNGNTNGNGNDNGNDDHGNDNGNGNGNHNDNGNGNDNGNDDHGNDNGNDDHGNDNGNDNGNGNGNGNDNGNDDLIGSF